MCWEVDNEHVVVILNKHACPEVARFIWGVTLETQDAGVVTVGQISILAVSAGLSCACRGGVLEMAGGGGQ